MSNLHSERPKQSVQRGASPLSVLGRPDPQGGPGDRFAGPAFMACALLTAAVPVALLWVVGAETFRFFTHVSPLRFFTQADWAPFADVPSFGVLPLLAATAQISAGAVLIAAPIGLLTALHAAHYASASAARVLDAVMGALAAVPTVILGYLALNLITPALRALWGGVGAFNTLSGCIAVGVMILPTVVVLARGALAAVPAPLLEAGLALGAPRGRVVLRVQLPAASAGVAAGVLLALARAVGETMIVTLAAGNQAQLGWSPLEGLRTLTAYIAQASLGDTATGTLQYGSFFAASAVLVAVSWGLRGAAGLVVARASGARRR